MLDSQIYGDVSPASAWPAAPRVRRKTELSSGDGGVTRARQVADEPPRLYIASTIVRESRIFRMQGTFMIEISRLDDGTVFARHRDLPIYGYGDNVREALAGFDEMFEMQWDALVDDDENNLTEGAKVVRQQLCALARAAPR